MNDPKYEQELTRILANSERAKGAPVMQQFQVNKWIRVVMSLGVAALGWAMAFDWTTVVNAKTAGTIVGILGFIKMAYAAFAPSSDKGTEPTGGAIITQKATS
jgi:hypothetical protein